MTIGILKAFAVAWLERLAERIARKIEAAGAGKNLSPTHVVVEKEPGPQHPGRPHAGLHRQHEPHRPHQMRRHPQHHLTLGEGFAHQPKPIVLQIPQAAVDELGRGRRRAGREVVLLNEQHAEPAASRVAGDAHAVDTTADDSEIKIGHAADSLCPSMARGNLRAQAGICMNARCSQPDGGRSNLRVRLGKSSLANHGNAMSDPTVSDPAASDPAVPDPAVSDPTASDPKASDPKASDPTASITIQQALAERFGEELKVNEEL